MSRGIIGKVVVLQDRIPFDGNTGVQNNQKNGSSVKELADPRDGRRQRKDHHAVVGVDLHIATAMNVLSPRTVPPMIASCGNRIFDFSLVASEFGLTMIPTR
ncbi:MAG: hypothetical protein ACLUEV_10370 [Alistipes sp.]